MGIQQKANQGLQFQFPYILHSIGTCIDVHVLYTYVHFSCSQTGFTSTDRAHLRLKKAMVTTLCAFELNSD